MIIEDNINIAQTKFENKTKNDRIWDLNPGHKMYYTKIKNLAICSSFYFHLFCLSATFMYEFMIRLEIIQSTVLDMISNFLYFFFIPV